MLDFGQCLRAVLESLRCLRWRALLVMALIHPCTGMLGVAAAPAQTPAPKEIQAAPADPGVDTLIFDTTNRTSFPHVYMKLCEVFEQVRKDGGRTPQLCFMVNTKAGERAREIYDALYRPGLYRDLWFIWEGRPLMICDPNQADPEVKSFFTLRKAHWPFEVTDFYVSGDAAPDGRFKYRFASQ